MSENFEENIATILRKKLREQPAYLVGQNFKTAPEYLQKRNIKQSFMLRSSGHNPDPGIGEKDELVWPEKVKPGQQRTHMIFGVTSLNAAGAIENSRYILGQDGSVTQLEVPVARWQIDYGTLTKNKWNSLDELVESWLKKGYSAIVSQKDAQEDIAQLSPADKEGMQEIGNIYVSMPAINYDRYVSRRRERVNAEVEEQKSGKEGKLSDEANVQAPDKAMVAAFELKKESDKRKEEADQRKKEEIEDEFICPITQEFMTDPVKFGDEKHAFERKAIEKWFAISDKHPMRDEDFVPNKKLTADPDLKRRIDEYVAQQKNKPKL